jgi:hypothetical protein
MPAVWRGATDSYRAYTRDISETGCFIEMVEDASLQSRQMLLILSPTGLWVELPASPVRYVSGSGVGLRFETLSEAERMALQCLVDYAEAFRGMES